MNMFPTLVVGLGGSGKLVCKFLKKIFMERFPKEWVDPVTGLPPIVDIIVIETQPGNEKEEEGLDLPDVPIIKAYVDETTLKAIQRKSYLNKNPDIKQWLFTPLPVDKIIGGAGQIRQAGRIAYFRNRIAYAGIKNILETALNSIGSTETISKIQTITNGVIKVPDITPRCYLISSVCGGTGSGMVLDVAGFLREKGASTRLIAFLPKMFESVIDMSEAIWLSYANTYATLKEINHYMTGGKWSVWYNKKAKDGVQIDKKIFDICFLIEKESNTIDLVNRKNVAPLISKFLFWQISEIEIKFDAEEINIRKFINAVQENWCSSVGIATVSFPLKEIKNILLNWGIRDILSYYLSDNFENSDIISEITNPNTGLFSTLFSYKNWEKDILNKDGYSTLSTQTILKKRGSLVSKLKSEINRLEKEFETDRKTMEKNYKNILIKVKNDLSEKLDKKLKEKGPNYTNSFLSEFEKKLDITKAEIEDIQNALESKISESNIKIQNNIKILDKISKTKGLINFGWKRRIEPHIITMLSLIKAHFDNLLLKEKHIYSQRIINELKELIEKKKIEINSLQNKIDTIVKNKRIEETKLWTILGYTSAAQVKVKSTYDDVEKLYNNHFEKRTLENIGVELRNRLLNWKIKTIDEIEREVVNALSEELSKQKFEELTIIDAMKDNLEELANIFKESMERKSMAFIKSMGEPKEDKFIITGFEPSEFKKLPLIPENYYKISSPIAKDKREIIFIRLASGFSIKDLAPYDFEDKYAKAYQEYLEKGAKWIHIFPEAIGFEDPLELSIGMEEEALIKTCQCVGIIWEKKSHHYIYEKDGKEVVLEQGLENVIRKLQNNPDIANELKQMLINFFNDQKLEWIITYLNDHKIDYFGNEKQFRTNHESKYKNNMRDYQYPLPPHKIPSYILDEINSRIKKGRK